MIKATNKETGEVIELATGTPEELVTAWKMAQEYEKISEKLKDQLKKIVPVIIKDDGRSEEVNGYVFKSITVQRMQYNKAILRQVLDEDMFDLFMEPQKTAIDDYIEENLDTLGELSTKLRKSMEPKGAPFQIIKLEKL